MARSFNYHGYTVFDDGTIPLSKRDHTPMFCFDNGRVTFV